MSELDDFFPRDETDFLAPTESAAGTATRLGVVVGGSLSKGLTIKLAAGNKPGAIIEDMAVGRYVVVKGQTGRKFFAIVTDILLESTTKEIAQYPPDPEDSFLAQVYSAGMAFGQASVQPMLMLDTDTPDAKPKPVKTVPAHFSAVYEATEADVDAVFGGAGSDTFHIGSPLDMESVRVHLDLGRFVERSSGVFGKSGTGKSFITRTILAGVVKARKASCLIFDMHNDYGWSMKNEHGTEYKGLRQLLPNQVRVYTLDPETSRHRGSKTDGTLLLSFSDIDPEDIELLAGVLGLSDVQVQALFFLRRRLGKDWVSELLRDDGSDTLDNLVEEGRIVQGTLGAIQRKFELFNRLGFLQQKKVSVNVVNEIFEKLRTGQTVVLEFGRYGDDLPAYMFVANYLTRRIHRRYVDAKNKAAGSNSKADEPNPLVIVIEEAHKFLEPEIAKHTIFGTIARELRKYSVTILLVDQRPSAIDDEVMSQLGTRVTCLLDNEADVRAVFSGVSGSASLREVLARLDTKQQALILGHAVPMPVVIRTRNYDTELYREIGWQPSAAVNARNDDAMDALYG
jgi:DNA helicase HerA-like ATPase